LKKPAAPSASTASTASSPAAPADGEAFKLRIDQVAVHGASVDWRDDSTASEHAPAAAAQLDKLELQAEAIAWPLQQPFDFKGSTVLAGAVASVAAPAAAPAKPAPQGRQATTRAARGKKGAKAQPPAGPKAKAAAPAHAGPASIQFAGRVGAAQGEVGVQVAGVPLALAGPYLAPYLVPRLAGTLGADARLQWALPKSAGAAPTWSVAAKRVQLDQLQWSGEGAPSAGRATPRRPTSWPTSTRWSWPTCSSTRRRAPSPWAAWPCRARACRSSAMPSSTSCSSAGCASPKARPTASLTTSPSAPTPPGPCA
jgi:hypothetical protein